MNKKTLTDLILETGASGQEDHGIYDLTDEIDTIKDPHISNFVKSILIQSNGFWISPATLDKQTHPPDEWGTGGLVLHTKRVVRVSLILVNTFECSPYELDVLTAAAILHDVTKAVYKTETNEIFHDMMHPYTVDSFVEYCRDYDEKVADASQPNTIGIDYDTLNAILRLIRCSHGNWSMIPETVPITVLERTLHAADLIATNIHILADGFEFDEDQWQVKK